MEAHMRVLIVEQFGKTQCSDTIAISEAIHNVNGDDVSIYLSDNSELPNREHHLTIHYGFHKAYEGNIISKVFHYLKSLRSLKKHIKENHYDIVNLQWFSIPWLENRFVKKIKKYSKVVILVHDVIPFENSNSRIKALDKIYALADLLLVHTEDAKSKFLSIYKAKTPIKVVGCSFCNKKDYTIINKVDARKHLNIPQEAIVYLLYGTMRPSKGFDLLIEAFNLAKEQNKDIYLICAGAAHSKEEKEYCKLSKEIENSKRGKFVFTFVPREEEPYYFSASDVLCLPYKELTQSGVAQLGLVYELPLIGTDVGSMHEVCRNNHNGLLIKQDANELAKAILELANKEKRAKFSKASKEMGENEFSLDKKAGAMVDGYNQILK